MNNNNCHINWPKLFLDYSIDYKGPNNRSWYEIECPYCHDGNFHGAIHSVRNNYYCWKCGPHSLPEFVRFLIHENWSHIKANYQSSLNSRDIYLLRHNTTHPDSLTLPYGTGELSDRHKTYLTNRGYDIDMLIKKYNIKGTNHLGQYPLRIMIPIYLKGKLISFTARDITGQAAERYMSCPEYMEVYNHKKILYGYETVPDGQAIVVEGILDKWAIGDNAVSTCGLGFTPEQVRLLSKFEKVIILFDGGESVAEQKADELSYALTGLKTPNEIILLEEGDPSSLHKENPKEFQLFLKKILNN